VGLLVLYALIAKLNGACLHLILAKKSQVKIY